MYEGKRVTALIMAAGSGTRLGGPLPKQFLKIGGNVRGDQHGPFCRLRIIVNHPQNLIPHHRVKTVRRFVQNQNAAVI